MNVSASTAAADAGVAVVVSRGWSSTTFASIHILSEKEGRRRGESREEQATSSST
jgi:hypothetical protein